MMCIRQHCKLLTIDDLNVSKSFKAIKQMFVTTTIQERVQGWLCVSIGHGWDTLTYELVQGWLCVSIGHGWDTLTYELGELSLHL